ncbi:uncharacterized protein LOC133188112 [Saccostrea echinata]|uniref:uncharacterized protein LOC133188112 n=1 Tax=Saccostrea echinata TaxID=191078 RepID=UPI002A80BF22|nr:uncharacterized protein LOC133188112 [Saccostrea echinata]
MFLPRPLFHINYYGNLDRNGTWLHPNTSYRPENIMNIFENNTGEVKQKNTDALNAPRNRKRKEKKKQKNEILSSQDTHLLNNQFILRQPQPVLKIEKKEEKCSTKDDKIDRNRSQSLIDAYKQSSFQPNDPFTLHNTSLQDICRTASGFPPKLSPPKVSAPVFKTKCEPQQRFKESESDGGKDICKIEIIKHDDILVPKNRISITKDPINAKRIQLCEQAKLRALHASDRTGIPLADIYTGRISFTDKKTEITGEMEEDVSQVTAIENDTMESNVCNTQPVAIPIWHDRTVTFPDNYSFSSGWTMSTSGCETEEPITLQEVREHMCYYVLCCGLCID